MDIFSLFSESNYNLDNQFRKFNKLDCFVIKNSENYGG